MLIRISDQKVLHEWAPSIPELAETAMNGDVINNYDAAVVDGVRFFDCFDPPLSDFSEAYLGDLPQLNQLLVAKQSVGRNDGREPVDLANSPNDTGTFNGLDEPDGKS